MLKSIKHFLLKFGNIFFFLSFINFTISVLKSWFKFNFSPLYMDLYFLKKLLLMTQIFQGLLERVRYKHKRLEILRSIINLILENVNRK